MIELIVKLTCGCQYRTADLYDTPVIDGPAYCQSHGEVNISNVFVNGAKGLLIMDMEGNWLNEYGLVSTDPDGYKEFVEGEDYDTFPPKQEPRLVIIYWP